MQIMHAVEQAFVNSTLATDLRWRAILLAGLPGKNHYLKQHQQLKLPLMQATYVRKLVYICTQTSTHPVGKFLMKACNYVHNMN